MLVICKVAVDVSEKAMWKEVLRDVTKSAVGTLLDSEHTLTASVRRKC